MPKYFWPLICASLLWLAGCSKTAESHRTQTTTHPTAGSAREHGSASAKTAEKGESAEKGEGRTLRMTAAQIAAAGIGLAPVRQISSDAIDAPGTIEAAPSRSEIVAVSVGGRITALQRNLGEPVRRGDALAVVESADAAQLKADLEAARRERDLAQATLQRETRLYQEKVSAGQDLIAAKAAAAESEARFRLAGQRLAAAGGSGSGPMNRLVIRSPISGYVIARPAVLGSVVTPNSELFRIADLSEVGVSLALAPDDASRVTPGAAVDISTASRSGTGRIVFVSRVIDSTTRQVQALASLPNAQGSWRVGETVRASIQLPHSKGQTSLAVPQSAVQTVEDKPTVFVRTPEGFSPQSLVLGPANGSYVAVLSGLTGEESVASTNSYVLKAELGKGAGGDDD